jgi:hypothetical protein
MTEIWRRSGITQLYISYNSAIYANQGLKTSTENQSFNQHFIVPISLLKS